MKANFMFIISIRYVYQFEYTYLYWGSVGIYINAPWLVH